MRRGWQRLGGFDPGGARHPARHLFVNRLTARQGFAVRWRGVQLLSVQLVGHANFNLLQLVENIQLGNAQAGDTVYLNDPAQGHHIDPATAPGPAGGRAEFLALVPQMLTDAVEQLRGKRSCADAGRVCLDDAEHVVDIPGADPHTGGGAARGGIG